MHEDPFDLQRLVTAQESVFETAIAELRGGRKQSHWMWFIFPQLRDVGRSSTAQFYGIASVDETRAYLVHPVLGSRLDLATRAVRCPQRTVYCSRYSAPGRPQIPFLDDPVCTGLLNCEQSLSRGPRSLVGGRMDGASLKLLDDLGTGFR